MSASCYDKIAHPPKGHEVRDSVMIGKNKAKPGGAYTVEDIAVGFAKLETGASVAFEFSWGSHIERDMTYMELLGTKGGLSMHDGVLKFFGEAGGGAVDVIPQVRNSSGWGENETRHFIDCVKSGAETLAPPEEAVKMMQIIDAIYASTASGREVVIKRPRKREE